MDLIKIGSYYYEIRECDNLARDCSSLGESCGNSLKISIDSGICEDLKTATLIHEIVEQLNFIYELNLEHNVITILGNTLHQVLKENENLIKKYVKKV